MARFNVDYDTDKDIVTKTLTYKGKEYSEVWTNNATFCKTPIATLFYNENSDEDINEEVAEIFEEICLSMNSDVEIIEMLITLGCYEIGVY